MEAKEVEARVRKEMLERELCRRRLLPFVQRNLPEYEAGWVHREICQKLEQFERDVVERKSPRLMLFMPPRHGKSELASRQFPAWFLGRHPNWEIITTSYSASLAYSFSTKVRQLVRSEKYQALFPNMRLEPDAQNKQHWLTTEGGGYLPAGVGGPISGEGAHVFVIDDPVKNRVEAESRIRKNEINNWYSSTAYTRLAPGGGILLIMTRWAVDDLAGWLLEEMKSGGDEWEIIVYPAIAVHNEEHRAIGEPLHPERYDEIALARIKRALIQRDWDALYQQTPVSDSGAIIKRDYWNRWTKEETPDCKYIIQSMDTAFLKSETADYSVISTWGLFYPEGDYSEHDVRFMGEEVPHAIFNGQQAHLILLDVVRGRWDFPELKDIAFKLQSYWEPDTTIIEAKASGLPLTHELRQRGLSVSNFTPSKGNDKVSRAHAISDVFANGYVWAPKTEWAEDLITECHHFPSGKNDDMVDTTTQAVMRFRQGGFIEMDTDYTEEDQPRRRRRYYT